MKSLSDFRKAHRTKTIWVGIVTAIVAILFVILVPDWFRAKGFIYPLHEGFRNIVENLFWAFSTGALLMWFERSVNDDAVLMENYREMRLNTKPLEECDLVNLYIQICEGADWTESTKISTYEQVNCYDYIDPSFWGLPNPIVWRDKYMPMMKSWVKDVENNTLFFVLDPEINPLTEEVMGEIKELINDIDRRNEKKGWYEGYFDYGKSHWVLDQESARINFDEDYDHSKSQFLYCEHYIYETHEMPHWTDKVAIPYARGTEDNWSANPEDEPVEYTDEKVMIDWMRRFWRVYEKVEEYNRIYKKNMAKIHVLIEKTGKPIFRKEQ